MNKTVLFGCALVLGLGLGMGGSYWWLAGAPATNESASDQAEPLYWVAPMDPNYRRDKPGKSPMGMDLIPVYADDRKGDSDPAGTVRINPDVVNNLGVRIAAAKRGGFETRIRTVGYVRYDEDALTHIHPRVEGWIEALYVKAAGDPVKQGQPLYAIYAPTLVNAQQELLLALQRKNRRLIDSARDRLRALEVPAKTVAAIEASGEVRQSITVFAPQTGVVDNLNVREGYFVKPGTTMLSIGQLEEVWVVGEVFERQASLVEVGDPVTMSLDYLPGRHWEGQVDYVYPTLDTTTRTAQLRVRLDNADGALKPGMFARLEIHPPAGEESLLIPREALIRTGEQNRVVLALGDGKFRSVSVDVGRVGDRQVEVLDGLKAGDKVVTSAQFLIDSESSKTADFGRMDHDSQDQAPMTHGDMEGHDMSAMGGDGDMEGPAGHDMSMDGMQGDAMAPMNHDGGENSMPHSGAMEGDPSMNHGAVPGMEMGAAQDEPEHSMAPDHGDMQMNEHPMEGGGHD
ncbi:efflux RND transporter periplasmic adaptor subunit [Marinobacteraceae bacterium S3BR75-40.1]